MMAAEFRSFTVTLDPGSTPAAPVLTNLPIPPRIVDRITIRVPPGPSGAVGFAIAAAGTPIIPQNAGQFIVADNEVIELPLVGYITSGAWQLLGYNQGSWPHSLQVRFDLSLIGANTVPAPVVPLEAVVLNQAPTDVIDVAADDTGADIPAELGAPV